MKRLLMLALLCAPTAQAQTIEPEAPLVAVDPQDDSAAAMNTLDCFETAGGAECTVENGDGILLYCLALDAAGDPLANSTVSSDAGVAVFNAVEVAAIARVTCRAE